MSVLFQHNEAKELNSDRVQCNSAETEEHPPRVLIGVALLGQVGDEVVLQHALVVQNGATGECVHDHFRAQWVDDK